MGYLLRPLLDVLEVPLGNSLANVVLGLRRLMYLKILNILFLDHLWKRQKLDNIQFIFMLSYYHYHLDVSIRVQLYYNNEHQEVVTSIHFVKMKTIFLQNPLESKPVQIFSHQHLSA